MGTNNSSAKGGLFTPAARSNRRHTGAGLQILFSLLLLADLFLLYTIIMQMTHQQKAFEASDTVNLLLLAFFAVAAVALIYAVIRTGAWKRFLCILLIFAVLYLTAAFSELPKIREYREMWIGTAMQTMRHQGLATYYFPASIVEARTQLEHEAQQEQIGQITQDTFEAPASDQIWVTGLETDTRWIQPEEKIEEMSPEQKAFYLKFYELDAESAEAWFRAHPEALNKGYEHILINETSLEKDGTTIRTKLGEKVLAIDVDNEILIVEVDCDGSRGVLAIAKQASRLHLFAASSLPYQGETTGTIAKRNGGILAMTGSSFIDINAEGEAGKGNGGMIAGWAMCGGKTYGDSHFGWGYKRLELHDNDWFYITDAPNSVGKGTTDAMEFQPALIINGNRQNIGIWVDKNPRACIGQSERGEILMLCVEGRRVGSLGCPVSVCTDVLLTHDCITALNCDGGTTAMLWYRGEPIIRCSNTAIPQGRRLPNAWVYVGE